MSEKPIINKIKVIKDLYPSFLMKRKHPEKCVYFGEQMCQGKLKSGNKKGECCGNAAYYSQNGGYFCGVHSSKDKRQKLVRNPREKEIKAELYAFRQKLVENAAKQNRANKKQGDVIVTKLRMMKNGDHHDGYLKVYPNFKHQNKQDGFGCASLSPKSMGPIASNVIINGTAHKIPKTPIAKSLENMHQAVKIFIGEVDKNIDKSCVGHFDGCDNRSISKISLLIRENMYKDDIPYRHKFKYPGFPKKCIIGDNVNIPLFSMYYDINGIEHRYNYLQCRYFYCHWYEIFAKTHNADFLKLRKMINDGYNLQLVGYDGYPIEKTLWDHYNDISKPFGHELVLYTLLICDDPKEYPWNQFYQKFSDIYKGVI